MSKIEFYEDRDNSYNNYDKKQSVFVNFIIKLGLAKDEKHANFILLGVVIVIIIITLSIFLNTSENTYKKITPENFVPAEL